MPSKVKEFKYVMFADAVSFAAAAAHAAASRVCGLLDGGEEQPYVQAWFFDPPEDSGIAREFAPEDINRIVEELGNYVCVRQVENAETLYIYARKIDGVAHAENKWADERFERRQCWEVFRMNCLQFHNSVDAVQKNMEAEALNAERAQKIKPVKIEDTIFEKPEKMGDLRPESVEAAKIAQKAKAAEKQKPQAPKVEGTTIGKPDPSAPSQKTQTAKAPAKAPTKPRRRKNKNAGGGRRRKPNS